MKEESLGRQLDQLPIGKWHWKIFFLIGFGLQINGFLNSSGSTILADLVDKGWSNNFFNALFSSGMMVGFFLGSIGGGILGDKIGRKKAYQLSLFIFALFSLLAGLAIDIYFLVFCRFAMGIGMGAGIVIGYASFTEFIPARVRGPWSAKISLLGNCSPLIAALVSYLVIPIFGWRMIFLIGSIASFIMLLLVNKFLDESPRWCIENNQKEKGEEILKKVIHETGVNQRFPPVANRETNNVSSVKEKKEKKPIPLKGFFKGDLGRRTLVATTVLIAMNISLYTITVWIPTIFVNSGIDIAKSLLMTTIMMVGAPLGVCASMFIMDIFPRKWLGVALILLLALLGYIYSLQTSEIMIVVIGAILIFILYIYNSFASAVYAPELWSTQTKMRGSGISNSIGRIVAILMPYLIAWLLTNFSITVVFIVLGILLSICALILAVFGIETRKKSVEEIAYSKSKKFSHELVEEIKTY